MSEHSNPERQLGSHAAPLSPGEGQASARGRGGAALARLYTQAWAEGETEAYLRAYHSVHETLRTMRNTNLLVQVVNTLLRRMERDGLTAVQAARATLPTLESEGGKLMVMAATVDICCNTYKPGQEVSRLSTPSEILR